MSEEVVSLQLANLDDAELSILSPSQVRSRRALLQYYGDTVARIGKLVKDGKKEDAYTLSKDVFSNGEVAEDGVHLTIVEDENTRNTITDLIATEIQELDALSTKNSKRYGSPTLAAKADVNDATDATNIFTIGKVSYRPQEDDETVVNYAEYKKLASRAHAAKFKVTPTQLRTILTRVTEAITLVRKTERAFAMYHGYPEIKIAVEVDDEGVKTKYVCAREDVDKAWETINSTIVNFVGYYKAKGRPAQQIIRAEFTAFSAIVVLGNVALEWLRAETFQSFNTDDSLAEYMEKGTNRPFAKTYLAEGIMTRDTLSRLSKIALARADKYTKAQARGLLAIPAGGKVPIILSYTKAMKKYYVDTKADYMHQDITAAKKVRVQNDTDESVVDLLRKYHKQLSKETTLPGTNYIARGQDFAINALVIKPDSEVMDIVAEIKGNNDKKERLKAEALLVKIYLAESTDFLKRDKKLKSKK